MTEQDFKFLGFKKEKEGKNFWFELTFKNHRFISCDNSFAESQGEWSVGYENTKSKDETYWFQNQINTMTKFCDLFKAITEYHHSLSGNHIKPLC